MSNYIAVPGLIADSDISGNQFECVKMTGSEDFEVTKLGANTDDVLGILQNDPDGADKAAEVAILGTCKARLGGTVARGDFLEPDADGELVKYGEITDGSAATINVLAMALQSGVDQDVIMVALTGNQGNHS